jgi:hypothetical protein
MTRQAMRPATPAVMGKISLAGLGNRARREITRQQFPELNMNKEDVYDNQLSPLILQIIGICKAQGIAMIASFNIAHDGEGPDGEDCSSLTCTSHLPDGDEVFDDRFAKCFGIIRQGVRQNSAMHITTQHADGSKTLTAFI